MDKFIIYYLPDLLRNIDQESTVGRISQKTPFSRWLISSRKQGEVTRTVSEEQHKEVID